MKNVKFQFMTVTAMVIISLALSACPFLDEDIVGDTLTYSVPLDRKAWMGILDFIAKEGRYVNLDLKGCTFVEGNQLGGLIRVTVDDGSFPTGTAPSYFAFDPDPFVMWGKDKILTIILPDDAQMINQAVEKPNLENESKDKESSAFRHFTNLTSVSGANVTLIGNYAFTDLASLKTVSFPRVGHTVLNTELQDPDNKMSNGFRVDIGARAFSGCTGLTEVTFNSAAVIGAYAFSGCTGLTRINFPVVWMIQRNAFEGCTGLTEVRFEKATKIGEEAFKNCTRLKNIYFNADPQRFTDGDPFAKAPGGLFVTYDSVIFKNSVFSGCTALERLDIRRAWNVFFYDGVLENIGTSLDIYLFDDDGTKGFGHPQQKLSEPRLLLGKGEEITLKEINLFVPLGSVNISENTERNIASYISSVYGAVVLTISKIN